MVYAASYIKQQRICVYMATGNKETLPVTGGNFVKLRSYPTSFQHCEEMCSYLITPISSSDIKVLNFII